MKQIARWVPRGIVKEAAESHGIRYRTFDPWSHLVTLLVVQLSHEESLNGVCDIAQAMSYEWERAGMEIPRRNTLSNANTKRDPAMAEDVFWGLFRHLSAIEPDFVSKNYSGYLARIRNHRLYALDSSTIQLVLNCIDWALHRRRKAAAKLLAETETPPGEIAARVGFGNARSLMNAFKRRYGQSMRQWRKAARNGGIQDS